MTRYQFDATYSGEATEGEEIPQILNRNTILPSRETLDAGDVIECYTLMRMAKLENQHSWSSRHREMTDNSNSTDHRVKNNNIIVQKSAIAFRYKPKSTSPDAVVKSPFELTLEYGPQRTGATQMNEAMPIVNGNFRKLDGSNDGNRDDMYLSWENHAKIYYTFSIKEGDWVNAYYMGSTTGAVLDKILDYIIEYPINHPRYQPFTVKASKSGETLLKSSNSDDFVWKVFRKLAEWYVAIEPILTPPSYGLVLHVENVKKIEARDVDELNEKHSVATSAAQFYQNLLSCVHAIKTGDYSGFERTPIPTISPTVNPTSTPSFIPSFSPTAPKNPQNTTNSTIPSSHNNEYLHVVDLSADHKNQTVSQQVNNSFNDVNSNDNYNDTEEYEVKHVWKDANNGRRLSKHKHKHKKTISSYTSPKNDTSTNGISEVPSTDENNPEHGNADIDDPLQGADDAMIAAEEAEKAAEKAKVAAESTDDNIAAAAAEHAAEAAKKAVQATSNAAAAAAKENLLSGDGDMVTSVVSTCFTDPKYNIQKDDAFLYIDGTNYWRLNLTAPYLSSTVVTHSLPEPHMLGEGEGDIVDFALAFAIIIGFFLGIVVMLHLVGVLSWNRRLRCRWFFQPNHNNDDRILQYTLTSRFEKKIDNESGMKQYSDNPDENTEKKFDPESFDAITDGWSSEGEKKKGHQNVQLSKLNEIEMTKRPGPRTPRKIKSDKIDGYPPKHNSASDIRSTFGVDEVSDQMGMNTSIDRDPDMVDFPDLKSKSRIAVPLSNSVVMC